MIHILAEDNNRSFRLLSLYERLNTGEYISKSQEAKRFEVSEKTIQRDLDELRLYFSLSNAGDEDDPTIVYSRTRKGYYLYSKRTPFLNKEEILCLVKILIESRAFPKTELKHLIDSLLRQIANHDRKETKEMVANEYHHFKELEHKKPLIRIVWDLSMAIKEHKVVKLTYQKVNQTEVSVRAVEPLGLLFSEYYFYLVAYIKAEQFQFPAVYRLDRITSYKKTNQKFKIPYRNRFEEGLFRKRIQFMQSGSLMRIRFRFFGKSLEAVLDRLPTATVVYQTQDEAIVETEVYGKGIKMWILSQAEYIEVLSPESFRQEMKDSIEKMTNLYR